MRHVSSAPRRAKPHKWLPFACVALAFVIAVSGAVFFALRSDKLNRQLAALQQQLADSAQQLQDAQQQVTQLQDQLNQLQNDKNNQTDPDNQGNQGNQGDVGNQENQGSQGGQTGSTGKDPDWDTEASVDAGGPSYQKLYPDFYAPRPYQATGTADKTIYLTFDDGPSERTDEVLDILKQEGIKATFFVLHYKDTASSHARMQRIVAEGHTLGFHSYTHKYDVIYASVEAYLKDAYQIFSEIKEATGITPTVFRCPGGSKNGYNKNTRSAILAEMERRGFVCHDWNLSVEDSVKPYKDAATMTDFVMSYVGNKTRGVMLLHDAAGRKETVKALPEIIRRLRDKGYTFAALTPDVKPFLLGGGK